METIEEVLSLELQKFRAKLFINALAGKPGIWLQILFKTGSSQLHLQIEN